MALEHQLVVNQSLIEVSSETISLSLHHEEQTYSFSFDKFSFLQGNEHKIGLELLPPPCVRK